MSLKTKAKSYLLRGPRACGLVRDSGTPPPAPRDWRALCGAVAVLSDAHPSDRGAAVGVGVRVALRVRQRAEPLPTPRREREDRDVVCRLPRCTRAPYRRSGLDRRRWRMPARRRGSPAGRGWSETGSTPPRSAAHKRERRRTRVPCPRCYQRGSPEARCFTG